MDLKVDEVTNDDVSLGPKSEGFWHFKSGGWALDFTWLQAEMESDKYWWWISVICELSQPWAELALIYMQGRLND